MDNKRRLYHYKMTTTRFCLVRHGETDWNAEHRFQGHTDIDLNARGLAQAEQMAIALKKINLQFDVLYTSDLRRAHKTAHAIEKAFGAKAMIDPELRERNLGALQGLTSAEAPTREPELWAIHLSRDLDHNLRGGESIQQFAQRIHGVLEKIRQRHLGKTILLVSHGGSIDMMYRLATQQALETQKKVGVANASLNWISHTADSWKVDGWGDTSHLEGLALDVLDL